MRKFITLVLVFVFVFLFSACKSGKSSYELALEHGFQGTEAEWLQSLHGESGAPGQTGENGKDGLDGARWYSGGGVPDEELGKSGDYYLNFSEGTVYEKNANGWEIKGALHLDENKQTVQITFDAGEGRLPAGIENIQLVEKGESLELPVPVCEGYVFLGWYCGDDINAGQATDLTVFSRDMTLYARWREEYPIVLSAREGDAEVGDAVFFMASYSGTSRAIFTIYLEKNGERRKASRAGSWIDVHNLQVSEKGGAMEIEGYLKFAEAGEYRMILEAEEDGISSTDSFVIKVLETRA